MPQSHLFLKQDAPLNLFNLFHSLVFEQLLYLVLVNLLSDKVLVLFACVFYHVICNCVHVRLFNLAWLRLSPDHGQLASIDVRVLLRQQL